MDSFENTNDWIKKTHENMCNEEKYPKKLRITKIHPRLMLKKVEPQKV